MLQSIPTASAVAEVRDADEADGLEDERAGLVLELLPQQPAVIVHIAHLAGNGDALYGKKKKKK